MEQGNWVEFHLVTTLSDGSPIKFDVSSTGDDYIDFANTMLYVKAKVTKANGENLDDGAKAATANLFLHSLFSQVNISLNGTLINSSTNTVSLQGHTGDAAQLWPRRTNVSAELCSVLQGHCREDEQCSHCRHGCGRQRGYEGMSQTGNWESRDQHDGTHTRRHLFPGAIHAERGQRENKARSQQGWERPATK